MWTWQLQVKKNPKEVGDGQLGIHLLLRLATQEFYPSSILGVVVSSEEILVQVYTPLIDNSGRAPNSLQI